MGDARKVDGRVERGRRTRESVLAAAASLASVDGLDGLSLAHLAAALEVNKSVFFAHWPTKEDLQLAVVDWAREQWTAEIVGPALKAPAGVRRLVALHDARMDFYRRAVLPGRCFFVTAQAEFDDRPGRVHDRLAEAQQAWFSFITSVAAEAVTLGELDAETDPRQIAYVVEALGEGVVTAVRLSGADSVFDYARAGIFSAIGAAGGDEALRRL